MPGTGVAVAELVTALEQARAGTDALFALLRDETLYERPILERHRLIFYLGHLEAFDWNLLCRRALDIGSFHPSFDRLFEFGIDPAPGAIPADARSDWPAAEEIRHYNLRARTRVDAAIARVPEEIAQAAIEHRLMHAETLAYLLHQLPAGALNGAHAPAVETAIAPVPARVSIRVPPGTATLGKLRGSGFGWDNEFDQFEKFVQGFTISKYKVTNGEYLEFVREGGSPPPFWIQRNGQWKLRTMFHEEPMPIDWPVYVTHDQATAFCKWRGAGLPSEAEYHRAAFGTPSGEERSFPWGEDLPAPARGNFGSFRWDPAPVTAFPSGDSAFGVSQLCGNGWEWTSTIFGPFPGFRAAPYYPNYSKPFFDGAHYVLKGGSPRTAGSLLRRSFRNWFRPSYPYLYATFRCAENS